MKRIVLNALGPLVGVLLAGGVFSLPAAAQTELKFGHVGAPGSLFDQSANEFAKRANEKLGGKAKVVVFGCRAKSMVPSRSFCNISSAPTSRCCRSCGWAPSTSPCPPP